MYFGSKGIFQVRKYDASHSAIRLTVVTMAPSISQFPRLLSPQVMAELVTCQLTQVMPDSLAINIFLLEILNLSILRDWQNPTKLPSIYSLMRLSPVAMTIPSDTTRFLTWKSSFGYSFVLFIVREISQIYGQVTYIDSLWITRFQQSDLLKGVAETMELLRLSRFRLNLQIPLSLLRMYTSFLQVATSEISIFPLKNCSPKVETKVKASFSSLQIEIPSGPSATAISPWTSKYSTDSKLGLFLYPWTLTASFSVILNVQSQLTNMSVLAACTKYPSLSLLSLLTPSTPSDATSLSASCPFSSLSTFSTFTLPLAKHTYTQSSTTIMSKASWRFLSSSNLTTTSVWLRHYENMQKSIYQREIDGYWIVQIGREGIEVLGEEAAGMLIDQMCLKGYGIVRLEDQPTRSLNYRGWPDLEVSQALSAPRQTTRNSSSKMFYFDIEIQFDFETQPQCFGQPKLNSLRDLSDKKIKPKDKLLVFRRNKKSVETLRSLEGRGQRRSYLLAVYKNPWGTD